MYIWPVFSSKYEKEFSTRCSNLWHYTGFEERTVFLIQHEMVRKPRSTLFWCTTLNQFQPPINPDTLYVLLYEYIRFMCSSCARNKIYFYYHSTCACYFVVHNCYVALRQKAFSESLPKYSDFPQQNTNKNKYPVVLVSGLAKRKIYCFD